MFFDCFNFNLRFDLPLIINLLQYLVSVMSYYEFLPFTITLNCTDYLPGFHWTQLFVRRFRVVYRAVLREGASGESRVRQWDGHVGRLLGERHPGTVGRVGDGWRQACQPRDAAPGHPQQRIPVVPPLPPQWVPSRHSLRHLPLHCHQLRGPHHLQRCARQSRWAPLVKLWNWL